MSTAARSLLGPGSVAPASQRTEVDVAGTDGDQASPDVDDSSPTRRAGAALFLAVVTVRSIFAVTAITSSWRISYDEPAELAIARFLAGRGRWRLFHAPTYQPGMGILMAPFSALSGSAEFVFRAGVLINCTIAGASALVLWHIGIRLGILGGNRRQLAVVAAIVALAPAVVPLSSHVWADPAVTLTFLLVVWTTLVLVDGGRRLAGEAAVLAGGAGYLFHGRMLPGLLLAIVASCSLAAVRRQWAHVGSCAALGITLFIAIRSIADHIIDELWQRPTTANSVSTVIGNWNEFAGVARTAVGQVWYQATATLGMAVLGSVVVGAAICGSGPNWVGLRRHHAAVLVFLSAPMLLMSVVFMASHTSAGSFVVYGRYNDDVLWPIVMIGIAESWSRRHSWRALWSACLAIPIAVIGVLSVLSEVFLGEIIRRGYVSDMVNGVNALGGSHATNPNLVGVVALGSLAAVVLTVGVAPSRPSLVLLVVGLLVLLGSGRIFSQRMVATTSAEAVEQMAQVGALLPPGEPIGYRFTYSGYFEDADQIARLAQAYQYAIPDHEFELVDDRQAPPKYTLSVADDPMFLGRATIIWQSDSVAHVLWQLDSNAAPTSRLTEP